MGSWEQGRSPVSVVDGLLGARKVTGLGGRRAPGSTDGHWSRRRKGSWEQERSPFAVVAGLLGAHRTRGRGASRFRRGPEAEVFGLECMVRSIASAVSGRVRGRVALAPGRSLGSTDGAVLRISWGGCCVRP